MLKSIELIQQYITFCFLSFAEHEIQTKSLGMLYSGFPCSYNNTFSSFLQQHIFFVLATTYSTDLSLCKYKLQVGNLIHLWANVVVSRQYIISGRCQHLNSNTSISWSRTCCKHTLSSHFILTVHVLVIFHSRTLLQE